MSEEQMDVPVTEQPKRRGRPKGSTNKPKDDGVKKKAPLVPDLDSMSESIQTEQKWWVGVLPDCPCDYFSIGGVPFSKVTNRPYKSSTTGKQERQALIGNVVSMTKANFDRMCEAMGRTVVRVVSKRDSSDTIPKGIKITIPTAEEVELRRKNRRNLNLYTKRPSDTPAARWLFAVPYDGIDKAGDPQSCTFYPPSLEDMGELNWIEE